MYDLLQVLGVPRLGDATFDTPHGTETFNEAKALVERFKQVGSGHVYINPPDVYANVCLSATVEEDPAGQFDASTAAARFVQKPNVYVWMVDQTLYVIWAIPPCNRDAVSPNGLQDFRKAVIASTQDQPIQWGTTEDKLPVGRGVLYPKPGGFVRNEAENARRYFYREMPPILRGLKKNTTLGKLYHGTEPLGTDETGKEVKPTPEAYDLAFAKAVVHKFNDNIDWPQLSDAIWCRRGAARRAGWEACDELARKVKDAQTKGTSGDGIAPGRTDPAAVPYDRSLRDRLFGLYYVQGQDSMKSRVEVEIRYKARHVFTYLKQRGARFYFFRSSLDVVFVVDGHHVVVDEELLDYQNWFVEHVELFVAKSTKGKELSAALRSEIIRACIQGEDSCFEAERAVWGLHREETETLYLCFDSNNVEMVRIRASHGPYADIEVVNNGTDEVTLRGMELRAKRFDYTECAIQKGGLKKFIDIVHHGQSLNETDKFWSTVYMLTSMLPEHPQRPIKFAYGKAGSGKSYAQFDWMELVYANARGSSRVDPTPFCKDVAFGGPFIVQDNMEESDRKRFNSKYLSFATGQSEAYRRLYTTDDQAVYLPNASIVLTAIEPFSKEEHVRRSLEFEYSREFHQPESERLDNSTRRNALQTHGDLMLSALLEAFSLWILPDYRGRRVRALKHVNSLKRELANKDAYIDFLSSMLAVGEAMAPVIYGDDFDAYEQFTAWLKGIGDSDVSARLDGDTVLTLFNAMRDHALHQANKPWGGMVQDDLKVAITITKGDQGFKVTIGPTTTSQLRTAMGTVHKQTMGGTFPIEGARALRARIKSLVNDPAFPMTGWSESKAVGKRYGNNNAYIYTFTSSDYVPLTLDDPVEPTPEE